MENTPFEFCQISGEWGELAIPNLAWIAKFLMLQKYI